MAEIKRSTPEQAKAIGVQIKTPQSQEEGRTLGAAAQSISMWQRGVMGLVDAAKQFGESQFDLGSAMMGVNNARDKRMAEHPKKPLKERDYLKSLMYELANEAKQKSIAVQKDAYMQQLRQAANDAYDKWSNNGKNYPSTEEAVADAQNDLQEAITAVRDRWDERDPEKRVAGSCWTGAALEAGVSSSSKEFNALIKLVCTDFDRRVKQNYANKNVQLTSEQQREQRQQLIDNGIVELGPFRSLAPAGTSIEGIEKFAREGRNASAQNVTGKVVFSLRSSTGEIFSRGANKKLLSGNVKFDEGIAQSGAETYDTLMELFDKQAKACLDACEGDKSVGSWLKNTRKQFSTDVQNQIKAASDEAKKQRRANLLEYINDPYSADASKIYDVDVLGAYATPNTYMKDVEKYGWKGVLMDGDNVVDVGAGNAARVMADSMIVTLAKRNYLDQEDYDVAAKVLREAAHLPPAMQREVQDFFRKTLEDAVRTPKAIADANKQNELVVADYMFKRGANTNFQLVSQMDGEKKSMALSLCNALTNVPEERRHTVLKTVFDSIQQGNWDKAHADQAFDDLMYMHEQFRTMTPNEILEAYYHSKPDPETDDFFDNLGMFFGRRFAWNVTKFMMPELKGGKKEEKPKEEAKQ